MFFTLQSFVCKTLSFWMIAVTGTVMALTSKYASDEQRMFYQFGPNEHLKILGFVIDDHEKYFLVVVYCFINSMFRTLFTSVLHPWLINNIQDESKKKPHDITAFAYEVTCVTTVYQWFDWFLYMNILLSQIDMVLLEICADLIMSNLVTTYYLALGSALDDPNNHELHTYSPIPER
jgi:hypothetical protein